MSTERQTQLWLRRLIERIDAVVWEADPNTFQFRYVSPNAERLLGYPAASWLEPGFWERALHPEDRAAAVAECAHAVSHGRDHNLSYRLVASDGSAVWVDDSVAVVPGTTDAPASLSGVLVNATTRRREEEHFRFLVENSSDIITILDPDGTIRYESPAIERILGYDQAELVGRDAFDYVHPEDVASVHRAFTVAAATPGFSPPVEFRFRHQNGSWRVLESIGRNMIGEPVGAILVTSRDVTARRYRAELQRMEAVGRLASGVAHDFNNILTVISGHAELLRAEVPAAVGDRTLELLRATDRGAMLTRRLLDFARHGRTEPGDGAVDLAEALPKLAELLRPAVGTAVEIAVEVEPRLPVVCFDQGQLDHVLLNLILNARDAMPAGGRITVTAARTDQSVLLRITDTGSGIPADVRSRLFEPFFSTKGAAGTGLGLATVKAFVESHGGTIDVESEEGAGTAFTISLRPAKRPTSSTAMLPSTHLVPAGDGAEVIVVDDDRIVRDLIGEALRRFGYRVHVADDARTAVALASRLDRIDVLVTDVSLQGMPGDELAAALLERTPALGVLFITGADQPLRTYNPGANVHVLEKPFTLQALAAAVAAVLPRRDTR